MLFKVNLYKVDTLDSISIAEFVEKSLVSFGSDVNNNRQLPNVYDGLKPSYRRVIYTAMELGNKMKTVTLSGTCVSRYHPHGDASLLQPISNLVLCGILSGNGNHGMKMLRGENLPPAAPRYTEVWISDKYKRIFSDLIRYVPHQPSELEGFNEPQYLPTPVPLCFLTGSLGIGFGVNARIPVFSVKSMIEAYFNNDPNLLEPSIDIILDKQNSELNELWTKGVGKIVYKFDHQWGNSQSGNGIYIKGDPTLFKPNLAQLEKWVNENKIFINDETDSSGQRLFLARNYNVKSLSNEKIEEAVEQACEKTRVYRLTVSNGTNSYLIPMYEWLKITVTNYLSLVDKYKQDKVSKYKLEKEVYENLPRVAEYLFNHRDATNEEICKALKLRNDIVSIILNKSINTLRNTETSDRVKSIEAKIHEFEKLSSQDYLMNIINHF